MSMSELDATVRDAIESSPGFDPDFDNITALEIIRTNQEFDGLHVYVHAVVVTTPDELETNDRVPVETLQVIVRDGEVISVERLSLHHI